MTEEKMSAFKHELHRYTLHEDGDGFSATCNLTPSLPPIARFSRRFLAEFVDSFDDVQSAAISFTVHLDANTIRALSGNLVLPSAWVKDGADG